jgi:calcineurin-like phosphoesterase family protein
MIWFTSDTHYNHKNICKGVTEWSDADISCRDFQTIEEMNDAIVNSINKYVMENDILYHLGDWSFGGINSIWEFRKQIKCKNIHLILGNHDEHIFNLVSL